MHACLTNAGRLLGLPFIPPFMNPSAYGSNILKGVNYASAGAGILWDTGLIFVSQLLPPWTKHPRLLNLFHFKILIFIANKFLRVMF